MTNEELIEYVAWANDEIAQVLRAALQPVVDSFCRSAWPVEHGHGRMMRKKIRRCYR